MVSCLFTFRCLFTFEIFHFPKWVQAKKSPPLQMAHRRYLRSGPCYAVAVVQIHNSFVMCSKGCICRHAMVGGRSACFSLRLSLVFDAKEQFLGVVADRDAEKLVPLRAQIVVDDLKDDDGRKESEPKRRRRKMGKRRTTIHTDKSCWRTYLNINSSVESSSKTGTLQLWYNLRKLIPNFFSNKIGQLVSCNWMREM